MYIHLPGVGGGEGPKTNRSTKKKKKNWAEPSKGTKWEGKTVCAEGSFGAMCVCGHLASLTQRKAPGYSKGSLPLGQGAEASNYESNILLVVVGVLFGFVS